LKQGAQGTINLADGVWQMVGNPYPSNIDFEQFAGTANLGQAIMYGMLTRQGSWSGSFVLVTRNGVNNIALHQL
jgi:uncharacterized circularly permuted ATP-grasp superfamily protein